MTRSSPFWLVGGMVCLALSSVGCKSPRAKTQPTLDSQAGIYDKAQIRYELDAGKLNVPLSVAHIEGQLVSYEQMPTLPRAKQSLGLLEVVYPHPAKTPGMALARVTIESRAPSSGVSAALGEQLGGIPGVNQIVKRSDAQTEEVWELDIPKQVLDRVVADLNQTGFFSRDTPGKDSTELTAKVDGRGMTKTWSQVQTLDEMMIVVRSRGHLLSYHHAGPSFASRGSVPSSVAAYRGYAATDAAPRTATTGYTAAGPAYPGLTANPAAFNSPPANRAPSYSPPATPMPNLASNPPGGGYAPGIMGGNAPGGYQAGPAVPQVSRPPNSQTLY